MLILRLVIHVLFGIIYMEVYYNNSRESIAGTLAVLVNVERLKEVTTKFLQYSIE
jgi:hypothetical protein